MDNLDKQLRELSKIEPSKGYIEASKNRLMNQIALRGNESWFRAFLKRVRKAQASEEFMATARMRLMRHITALPQPIRVPLRGFALFLNITKKAVASTMVMLIAVTSTLFFVEGNTVVEASDDSYLEVIAGSASIKHADLIVWEDINGLIEIQAGDLIKVEQGGQAVIHFFDDSELRLGENTMMLITQLAVSPNFGRQGIIETSLHEGQLWAQSLSVEDGYAGFTVSTRDAIIKTLNGTFAVDAKLNSPTNVQIYGGKATLTSLIPETRQEVEIFKLAAEQKASIHIGNAKPIVTTEAITEQDKATSWVQENLTLDAHHLSELREKSIDRLTQTAGTLPGEMLYPIKQTKERLRLAFSSDSDMDYQIELANRRLSEAIVLFETGEQQKGREALMAYQSLARQIADAKGNEKTEELEAKLIAPHKKILTAELPSDAGTSLVKEALHQTAEILTDDPIELEKVRLSNSVQRLQDVAALVETGDLSAAKEGLVNHQLATSDALSAAESIEDEELRKEVLQDVLELRQEELSLLASLSEQLKGDDDQKGELSTMVQSAAETAEENVEITLAAAIPFMPELIQETEELSPADIKMAQLIDKIYIYNTWEGQQNQIERLLKNDLQNPGSMDYLVAVRDKLEGRARDYLNVRILQLEKKAELQKHKAMQRKIERAKRLRES